MKEFITSKNSYSLDDIKLIIRQLLNAVKTIHNLGLIHRDIKPGNIIIDTSSKNIRLIDFGLTEFYFPGKEMNVRIATKPFKPPEILVGHRKYFQAFDMWGVGCILGCLVFL